MFKVVATVFSRQSPMGLSYKGYKNYIKTHEATWPLELIGSKYDCTGRGTPHKKMANGSNRICSWDPRWVLDARTDWPPDRQW
jgi:hypothetical protein